MKRLIVLVAVLLSVPALAQVDRHDVRAGNRKFNKENVREAEIDYRKAVVKDSTSFAAQYNLASALYRQQDYDGAAKALDAAVKSSPAAGCVSAVRGTSLASDAFYNAGDVALQKKDYASAVDAFRKALLENPGDLDAKENYIYAKLMLQNQQNGGGGQDQNQDQNQQNQDQNQDQQDQNQDQNQDRQDQNQDQQNQDQQDQPQPQESKISPQQAQQMLKAIQAREKETQDKVNKEKAALLQSKQKEKNW